MKAQKPKAELVCKQFEDALAPRLRLSTTDRAVYYHLLRHSRFEGKSRLHFSIIWLARNLGLTEEGEAQVGGDARRGPLKHQNYSRGLVGRE